MCTMYYQSEQTLKNNANVLQTRLSNGTGFSCPAGQRDRCPLVVLEQRDGPGFWHAVLSQDIPRDRKERKKKLKKRDKRIFFLIKKESSAKRNNNCLQTIIRYLWSSSVCNRYISEKIVQPVCKSVNTWKYSSYQKNSSAELTH